MKRRVPKDTLLELDGRDITPETVDSIALLRLADAFFKLTVKLAESSGLGLTYRGLKVLDKCVAVAATPTNPKAAQLTVARAVRVVRGDEPAPVGVEQLTNEARRALRQLDPEVRARFGIGKRLQRIRAPELPSADTPWEILQLRVIPLRVGGKQRMTADLTSLSEAEPFSVDVQLDEARRLGQALRLEVDVRLKVCRDIDGRIERGEVLEVAPIQDADPAAAWQDWFAEQEPAWEAIEDVGAELGRAH